MTTRAFRLKLWVPLAFWSVLAPAWAQLPPDSDWTANSTLAKPAVMTLENLGAGQGVSLNQGHLYFYGDLYHATPRIGVIHEYTLDFKPTGRTIRLTVNGKDVAHHPTGLTWDKTHGCFLGNTVDGKATIFKLDWEQALADGTLDHAVQATMTDDAAVNGCRPCFVQLAGKTLLASADYGDFTPQVRLYDPARLVAAGRSSAPGVVCHRFAAGPYNQNLHWEPTDGVLVCVQNIVAGRGYQLDMIDLAAAVQAGDVAAAGVRKQQLRFAPHDELEGYTRLADGRVLLYSSSPSNNLRLGVPTPVDPFLSPAGTMSLSVR